jgi:uncharacterized peroxidase-related enzyme
MTDDVIRRFTRNVPEWRPRVVPVKLAEATPEQLEALQVTPSNTKVSDYVLVLAHDVETLKVRSPLFNAIMYGKGGLSRAERELGALSASVVNHCIYCAAVHADRHAQLSKDTTVTDRLFAAGGKGRSGAARPRDLRLRPPTGADAAGRHGRGCGPTADGRAGRGRDP